MTELTEADIVRAAKTYFNSNSRTIGYIMPPETSRGKTEKEKKQ
jgi:hypothetical protein